MIQYQRNYLVRQFASLQTNFPQINGFRDIEQFFEAFERIGVTGESSLLGTKYAAFQPNIHEKFGPENIEWLAITCENDLGVPTYPSLKGYDDYSSNKFYEGEGVEYQIQFDVLEQQYEQLRDKHPCLDGFANKEEFIATWVKSTTRFITKGKLVLRRKDSSSIKAGAPNVAYRLDDSEDAEFGPENIAWLAIDNEEDERTPTIPSLRGYRPW